MKRYKFFSNTEKLVKYRVPDCEHEGDISSAENELGKLGCKVVTSDWDGEDGGEAWIYCLISDNKINELKSKYGYSFRDAEYMRKNFERRKLIK